MTSNDFKPDLVMKPVEMSHDRNTSVPVIYETDNNQSILPEPSSNQHYHLSRMIETYFVPLTCLVGLVCNTLATKTFFHRNLRKYSCSMFLITKSISDSIFLLNLSVIYISGSFSLIVTQTNMICKAIIFVTYVSGFVSVWTVLLVTMENFIRILFPFDVKRLCTPTNAKVGILIIVLTSFCIYHFALWITDDYCQAKLEYTELTQAFVFIDTLLTLIVPSILLVMLIVAIFSKLLRFHRSSKKQTRSVATQTMIPLNNLNTNGRSVTGHVNRKSNEQIAAVTKMLLAVSLTFFILTVPSHIIRIMLLVSIYVQARPISITEAAVQRVAQLFFYSSMAVNLFIFLLFGKNFRRVFKKIFFKGKPSEGNVMDSDKDTLNVTDRINTIDNLDQSNDDIDGDTNELSNTTRLLNNTSSQGSNDVMTAC